MADSHTTEAIRTSGGVRVLREDLAAGAATATGRTMGITFPKPQQAKCSWPSAGPSLGGGQPVRRPGVYGAKGPICIIYNI